MAVVPNKRAGDAIYLKVFVKDGTVDPPQLVDPTSGPIVDIYRPDGSTAVTSGVMTKVSTGIYTYIFQTQTTDLNGQWLVDFIATDGAGHTSKSLQYGFFNLTA